MPQLHVLVNCAGLNATERELTVDGIERQLAVNHLSYFLLTNLLLDTLKSSAPSRVVVVASSAEKMGRIDFDDLMAARKYDGNAVYAQSKLANLLFTYELARRLEGTGVTVNAVHPGLVRTNLKLPGGFFGLMARMIRPFAFVSPEKGADTVIWAASAKELEGRSGEYFWHRKPLESSPQSRDLEIARKLWEVSAQLTKLADERAAAASV
jgi:NAD(P)-dependent dehydrogenase (short-subunit alcohol dehydrogenase family)